MKTTPISTPGLRIRKLENIGGLLPFVSFARGFLPTISKPTTITRRSFPGRDPDVFHLRRSPSPLRFPFTATNVDFFYRGNTLAREKNLQVGDPAPQFTLPQANGEPVSLTDFRGRSAVVLFFYPKDETPGCTAEACSFRDSFEAFRDAGAEVIGISNDSVQSHGHFASRFRLPFLLLSDAGGVVRQRYGVPKTLGILPGRTTYVIDREGVVRLIFSSQFSPTKHVAEALSVLKNLEAVR